jgi:ABC-type branched-subunit amino acid transport system ATPase component
MASSPPCGGPPNSAPSALDQTAITAENARECSVEGLTATDVTVRFGGLVALNQVSIQAVLGRITGLIGPNGAGKTTMFNVCCGFQPADHGSVAFDGADITRASSAHRARMGLGRTFQRMELFRSLTVRENVGLAAETIHVTDNPLTQLGIAHSGPKINEDIAATTDELLDLTGLSDVADNLAGEISTGQARLLELARALARRPRLLLLDEPSSGLDARESAAFGELLVRVVREQGIGILMIEHDMSLVLRICEWIFVLDFGRSLTAGTPTDVRSSSAVRDAYLGKGAA